MAKETLKDVIFNNDTPAITDKYLEVQTIRDGYTGTHYGSYNYKIVNEGGEYFVYPVETDGKGKLLTKKKSPIIYTDDNVIYFVVSTINDPYNHPTIIEDNLEGKTREKQVLQAFLAFVESNFKLGVYNVFYVDTDNAFNLKDSNSTDADEFEDVDEVSVRESERNMAWGNTRTELRPYPFGEKDAIEQNEKAKEEEQEVTETLKDNAGTTENETVEESPEA